MGNIKEKQQQHKKTIHENKSQTYVGTEAYISHWGNSCCFFFSLSLFVSFFPLFSTECPAFVIEELLSRAQKAYTQHDCVEQLSKRPGKIKTRIVA